MNFETIFPKLREGCKIVRKKWLDFEDTEIYIRVQKPDKGSMNTLPYIVMYKNGETFPVPLSCESLFAEDWLIYEQG